MRGSNMVPSRTYRLLLLGACALAVLGGLATAAVEPRHGGYPALAALLGERLPTGRAVRVMQIEGAMTSKDERASGWAPDAGEDDLSAKRFLYPGPPSRHATGVARQFYGPRSMSPDVTEVEAFPAPLWAHDTMGFLCTGTHHLPRFSSARVANHSWVGGRNATDALEVLKRTDYVVERDDFLQVVGANNGPEVHKLLQCSYNAICVGRAAGRHSAGTLDLGEDVYVAGRAKPDIVAPARFTSIATPRVASAVAMLLGFGHESGGTLSRGSYRSPRTGTAIYHAETSEVLKAALMAGADRGSVRGYRGDAAHRTDNGLDLRYGSGELNVLNSYAILAGGEWDSIEDDGPEGGRPGAGFDYDPAFGGLDGSNEQASYRLKAPPGAQRLKVCLAWNIRVNGDTDRWNGRANLHDLDLKVYDLDHSQRLPVAESMSWVDNTENAWVEAEPGHRYEVHVLRARNQHPFRGDYGLAWQFEGPGIAERIVGRPTPAQSLSDPADANE